MSPCCAIHVAIHKGWVCMYMYMYMYVMLVCMWQQVKREWRCYFLKHEAQPSKVSPTLCMEMPTSASAEI
jgi:hypothetical protein